MSRLQARGCTHGGVLDANVARGATAMGGRDRRLHLLEISMQARGRGELLRVVPRIQLHQDGVEIVEDLAGEKDQLVETRIKLADANSRSRFDENDVA